MRMLSILLYLLAPILLNACGGASSEPPASEVGESQEAAKPDVKLFVLHCGNVRVNDLSLFTLGENEGETKEFVVPCYLIQHPDGMLLWDLGLADAYSDSEDGVTTEGGAFHLTVTKT